MTHVCESLPTNPDGRGKRGEGRPHGCTTSCGAGTELHGHLGFPAVFLLQKYMCRHNTPVSTACLPPVPSTAAVSQRKGLAAQGTVAKPALGTSSWVASALSHAPRGQGCPPPSSCICSANRRPMASRGLAL